jgi:hypothetical protein
LIFGVLPLNPKCGSNADGDPTASVADREMNCDTPSMRDVYIDCSGVSSTDEFWQCYLDAVKPEGAAMFGRNLDAFWDAVEGGGPGWPGDVTLVFTHSNHLSELRTQCGSESFLNALKLLADQTSNRRVKFVD